MLLNEMGLEPCADQNQARDRIMFELERNPQIAQNFDEMLNRITFQVYQKAPSSNYPSNDSRNEWMEKKKAAYRSDEARED